MGKYLTNNPSNNLNKIKFLIFDTKHTCAHLQKLFVWKWNGTFEKLIEAHGNRTERVEALTECFEYIKKNYLAFLFFAFTNSNHFC